MVIERIAPILTVDDLTTAIAEHAGVLGMRVVMNMGWVAFLADDSGYQIGLMTTDATAPVNPDVSVFVDDVEAAHSAAVASGLEIVHPPDVGGVGGTPLLLPRLLGPNHQRRHAHLTA